MHEINLLPKRKGFDRSKKILRLLRIASILSLTFVLFAAVALFFLQTRSPLPALKKEEEQLVSELTKNRSKIEKHVIVQDRLKNIEPILTKRKDQEAIIDFFTQKAPPGVNIKTLNITTESVSLSVSATSVFVANTFIDELLQSVEEKSVIDKLSMDNFLIDAKTNTYSFSIKTNLATAQEKPKK